jgi:hypothetical protein
MFDTNTNSRLLQAFLGNLLSLEARGLLATLVAYQCSIPGVGFYFTLEWLHTNASSDRTRAHTLMILGELLQLGYVYVYRSTGEVTTYGLVSFIS